MKADSTQLRKGVLDLVILTLLSQRPMYGGELLEECASRPSLKLTQGTLYPLLSRLRTAGFVTFSWKESSVGPPRKYYALTPQGQTFQESLLTQWRELSQAIETLVTEKENNS